MIQKQNHVLKSNKVTIPLVGSDNLVVKTKTEFAFLNANIIF